MSAYLYQTETNDRKDSQFDVLGHLMPARAFFFVVVEEPGKDGFLTRHCYASVDNQYLKEMKLFPVQEQKEVFPEKYGVWPRDPDSTASIADHVLENEKITKFVSASTLFPAGSPRFDGKSVYIDIAKAKRSGVRFVATDEILQALDHYAVENPQVKKKVERIVRHVRNADGEVLLHGKPVPPYGVFTERSLAGALGLVKYARVVQVFGIVFTAYDLGVSADQSFHAKNVQPIEKELVLQAGGWGGAVAGVKIGGAAGALVGIEAGPGAVITGLIGGIVFGAIGYFGAGFVADHIHTQ